MELRQDIWFLALVRESNERLLFTLYSKPHKRAAIYPLRCYISPFLLVNSESRVSAKKFYNVQLKVRSMPAASLPKPITRMTINRFLTLSDDEIRAAITQYLIHERKYEEFLEISDEFLLGALFTYISTGRIVLPSADRHRDAMTLHLYALRANDETPPELSSRGPLSTRMALAIQLCTYRATFDPTGQEKGVIHICPEHDTFLQYGHVSWSFAEELDDVRSQPCYMGRFVTHMSEPIPSDIGNRVTKVAILETWRGGYQRKLKGMWYATEYLTTVGVPSRTVTGSLKYWRMGTLFPNVKVFSHGFLDQPLTPRFISHVEESGGKNPLELYDLTTALVEPEEEEEDNSDQGDGDGDAGREYPDEYNDHTYMPRPGGGPYDDEEEIEGSNQICLIYDLY